MRQWRKSARSPPKFAPATSRRLRVLRANGATTFRFVPRTKKKPERHEGAYVSNLLILAVGIVVGAGAAWLVASARARAAIAESESKSRASEVLLNELRAGLDAK